MIAKGGYLHNCSCGQREKKGNIAQRFQEFSVVHGKSEFGHNRLRAIEKSITGTGRRSLEDNPRVAGNVKDRYIR